MFYLSKLLFSSWFFIHRCFLLVNNSILKQDIPSLSRLGINQLCYCPPPNSFSNIASRLFNPLPLAGTLCKGGVAPGAGAAGGTGAGGVGAAPATVVDAPTPPLFAKLVSSPMSVGSSIPVGMLITGCVGTALGANGSIGVGAVVLAYGFGAGVTGCCGTAGAPGCGTLAYGFGAGAAGGTGAPTPGCAA
ncbi:hypothetical protein BC01_166 [Bacillus phage BC01]|nr:hypothetical protein BC01_166 [Bacillus phage BC01]